MRAPKGVSSGGIHHNAVGIAIRRFTQRPQSDRTLLEKVALVQKVIGLAISFALPTFAQQKDTPDPQLREKLVAAIKKHTDALDKNDSAAVVANFTEDAVNVGQDGPTFGRDAIEKLWADRFQKVQFSNNIATPDEHSPHIRTDGKQMWATGSWINTRNGTRWPFGICRAALRRIS